jgi:hypothetical protein
MRTKQLICFASFVLMLGVVAGTTPVSSAQTIDSVVRGGSSIHIPPVIAPNTLGEDELCFVDRVHQYNAIPIDLLGAEYVMVANNDKTQVDYSLEVRLNIMIGGCWIIKLYLFLDNRLGGTPGGPGFNPNLTAANMTWVTTMGFIDTGYDIGIDEEGDGDIDQWSSVYAMDSDGSTITLLQQNDATPGGRNMYGVAALHSPNPNPCWPDPYPGTVDVPVDANLSWPRGDDTIQEEVYFGTDPCMTNLPKVATILSAVFPPLYDPPTDLIASTTYYWYVVETSGNMVQAVPVPDYPWSFTTVRGEAQPDFPFDGALITGDTVRYLGDEYIWTKLTFIPGPTAVSHVGYFHEDYSKVESRDPCAYLHQPPYHTIPGWEYTFFAGNPQVPPAVDTLVRGTKYYWTVDANDALGNTFAGDIWEFSIQGYKAFEPSPVDGANDVDPNVLLSWLPGYDVQEHDVYMGTNREDVNNAVYNFMTPPPECVTTTAEPNFMVTGLPKGIKQYWRVDQVSGRMPPPINGGTYYTGDVWCFTITPPDLNNDGSINFKDYTILSNNLHKIGPNLPGDINKDYVVDYKDLRILMENWLWNL